MMPADRYIEAAALVAGCSAWLFSRILRSPNVAAVLASPPSWVDRAELNATVSAVHRAGRTFEAAATAPEREDATMVGAVVPDCPSAWTVARAAEFLRLSPRRVQELAAAELGGTRIGRVWLLDEVAVREYEHLRRGVT
ncbi:MAG: helix-turn-helix domain-containing protein [Pseudonocardiaceae bacterium]